VANVRKFVAFCVEQHNRHLPPSAFQGQTPDEMYWGTGDGIPEKLKAAQLQARELRLKTNRERNCHMCLQATPVGYLMEVAVNVLSLRLYGQFARLHKESGMSIARESAFWINLSHHHQPCQRQWRDAGVESLLKWRVLAHKSPKGCGTQQGS
jgi:hypothetical protein